MCKWGNTIDVEVTIPADLSHTQKVIKEVCPIDSCIASFVEALENAGIYMRGSCCGHGKGIPEITLADGRLLKIHPRPRA